MQERVRQQTSVDQLFKGKKRPRLAPELSVELQDLDPLLHAKWQSRVSNVFRNLDSDERKYAYLRYLAPKGIRLHSESKRFVFAGRPGLSAIRDKIKTPQLARVGSKLQQALDTLSKTSDVNAYIDIMESSISAIDDFDPNDDLAKQKEKLRVRQAFLDELVTTTRAVELSIPENYRGLTANAVKTFIIEVFLHHQMAGYRFNTLALEKLQSYPHEFIRGYVAAEAQVRQCDIVRTERYLFLIGPVKSHSQNPYSARRFMNEDVLMNGGAVFFNGVALPFESLDSEEIVNHLKWSISRIVSLERQVSSSIKELVQSFQTIRRDSLSPLLVDNIIADGSRVESAIREKLNSYEQILTSFILKRLPKAVTELARTHDDHDFLYFNLRDLILQLANDIRDFCSQFAVSFSEAAEELELRILCYLRLLEKRQDTVFSLGLRQHPQALERAQLPIMEYQGVMADFSPKAQRLEAKISAIQLKITRPKTALLEWWDRALNLPSKRRVALDRLESDCNLQKKRCLVSLIRICKRYPDLTVYLEFEDLVEVDETVRHYALPAGKDGISELPKLIRLWEEQSSFDFEDIARRLSSSVVTTTSTDEKYSTRRA